uniref:Uncharacterized protein n=1 Tax=Oryza sativa subsp. japonica TaxID=39947 RepID=Q6K6U5_ORYSJ|nr:hypothetical protein [Oryza sativa Japonica Group]BAD21951.1 hypothetical protein [Oryza sativa Japonica Group]
MALHALFEEKPTGLLLLLSEFCGRAELIVIQMRSSLQQQIHHRLSSSPPLPLATTNGADACGSAAGSPAFSRRGVTQLGSSLSR